MFKNSYWKYIIYTILIITYLFLNAYITHSINTKISITYKITPMMTIYIITQYIIFGLILGLNNIIREKNKEGSWRINAKKLLILGLPILLIYIYTYNYHSLSLMLFSEKLTPIMHKDIATIKIMSGVILGYIIISCFYKEQTEAI